MSTRVSLGVVALAAAFLLFGARTRAHVTVVSQFTYQRDVLPILQRRCGQCHAEGGVARTLLTYQEARTRSGAMLASLVSGRMPPSYADSGRATIKEQQSITASELDVLTTWTFGGTPEGPRQPGATAVATVRGAMVPNTVTLSLPSFTLAAGKQSDEVEVSLPTSALEGKWIRAVDVMPGAPAIVRRATIALKTPAGEEIVGLWNAGDVPEPLEGNAAFEVPSGAVLSVRLHYQRPAIGDAAVTDLSRLAVFLANPSSSRGVTTVRLSDVISVDKPLQVVGFRSADGPMYARVTVMEIGRGVRAPLFRLRLESGWPRRYVLAAPITVPAGSRIEAIVTRVSGYLWRTLLGTTPEFAGDERKFGLTLEILQ